MRPVGQAVKTPPFHGGNMGSSPVRVTSKSLNRTLFGLGILLFGTRTGMVKNPSVRARRFIADALRKMLAFSLVFAPRVSPFKGVGDSREKVRFRLVKGYQQKPRNGPSFLSLKYA